MGEKDGEKSSAALTVNVQVSAISKPKAGRFEQGILDGCRDALLEMTCPVLGDRTIMPRMSVDMVVDYCPPL